jgi:GT2 family glycosyltransferase
MTEIRARPAPPPAAVADNDWRAVRLPAPDAAALEPLSVVLPCFEGRRELGLALAALERQIYPRDRFEVVVVDDGSTPSLAVPAATELAVRVVRQPRRGFGLARARNRGARAAAHEILVFLDADLVAAEGLLAAHARWHGAVSDALTLGFCAYADVDGLGEDDLRRHRGGLAGLFAQRPCDRPWTERHMARTDDLAVWRDDAFRAVAGNNLGIRRALFDAIGGFDESFDRYGWEDTEFGYRVQNRGALLVPERAAFAWHQGRYAANRDAGKRRDVAAQRARGADRIAHPDFRRPGPGPRYAVPRTVVTVPVAGRDAAAVAATVVRLLAGRDRDLAVRIGTEGLSGEAVAGLRGSWRGFGAVSVGAADTVLDDFPDSPFHVATPVGAAFGADLLPRLHAGLGDAAVGEATLPDGSRAAITRAWALHRAGRAGGSPADYGGIRRFALVGPRKGALWAGIRWRAPAAGRPLRGMARAAAEAWRVRNLADLGRYLRWLGEGVRWRLGLAGKRRSGGASARRRRVRVALRPLQLLALAARRARRGRRGDLLAAAGLARAAVPMPADRFQAAARRVRRRVAGGMDAGERAAELLAAARCMPERAAARVLVEAVAEGDAGVVRSMARTAARRPDFGGEKIVSRRYGFLWLCNPKAASRSLIAVLSGADPEAVLVREATLGQVYAAFPEARGYLSFAFVRDPVSRVRSCHADKVLGDGNVALDAFHGLRRGMDLDAFCAWLATPWGSDAFADRHWLSQDVLLRERADGLLPDFLGRFEHLAEDLGMVAGRLGLPLPELPRLNASRPARETLGDDARALLARRYARDFALGGYAP